ncbi:MAG: hypothetical protein PF483_04610 [Halothiobacillus sp.]|nr:hypothetical protein [Halothiobacillus sp.]
MNSLFSFVCDDGTCGEGGYMAKQPSRCRLKAARQQQAGKNETDSLTHDIDSFFPIAVQAGHCGLHSQLRLRRDDA